MKIRRFQTDRRLWFWIALILFVPCWFIPFLDVKGDQMSPFDIFQEVAVGGHLTLGMIVDGFFWVIFCTFLFAVPSVVFAWIVQCAVVIIRTRKREKIDYVA